MTQGTRSRLEVDLSLLVTNGQFFDIFADVQELVSRSGLRKAHVERLLSDVQGRKALVNALSETFSRHVEEINCYRQRHVSFDVVEKLEVDEMEILLEDPSPSSTSLSERIDDIWSLLRLTFCNQNYADKAIVNELPLPVGTYSGTVYFFPLDVHRCAGRFNGAYFRSCYGERGLVPAPPHLLAAAHRDIKLLDELPSLTCWPIECNRWAYMGFCRIGKIRSVRVTGEWEFSHMKEIWLAGVIPESVPSS